MVQEGTHNPNVTLKGLPKEILGFVWSESSQNRTNHTISPQKGGLSLTLTIHGQTYSPKCKPKRLTNEILGFSWDGHMYIPCNTANFSDWLIVQN